MQAKAHIGRQSSHTKVERLLLQIGKLSSNSPIDHTTQYVNIIMHINMIYIYIQVIARAQRLETLAVDSPVAVLTVL